MPRICYFNGIAIYAYYDEHEPPHIHARYAGEWVILVIEDGSVYRGKIHPLALAIVREWMKHRKPELMAVWEAAAAGKKLQWVPPLGKGGKRRRR